MSDDTLGLIIRYPLQALNVHRPVFILCVNIHKTCCPLGGDIQHYPRHTQMLVCQKQRTVHEMQCFNSTKSRNINFLSETQMFSVLNSFLFEPNGPGIVRFFTLVGERVATWRWLVSARLLLVVYQRWLHIFNWFSALKKIKEIKNN